MLRPPNAIVPPTVPDSIADTRGRLLRSEQRQDRPDYTPRFCLTAVNAGPMSGSAHTQRWWPWLGAVDLEYVIATADGASGDHEILVQRSGLPVVTINGTGDSVHRIGADARWSLGDWVDVVSTGTISSLCVQMHFRGQGGGGLVFPYLGPSGWTLTVIEGTAAESASALWEFATPATSATFSAHADVEPGDDMVIELRAGLTTIATLTLSGSGASDSVDLVESFAASDQITAYVVSGYSLNASASVTFSTSGTDANIPWVPGG